MRGWINGFNIFRFFATGESSWYLPLIACVGSFIATGLVYYFGRQAERITPNRLLLAGVAVNAGISALTLIGSIRVSKDNYQFVTAWLAGTIWGRLVSMCCYYYRGFLLTAFDFTSRAFIRSFRIRG